MSDFTVAILAGGKSSRMGRNKAFIKIGGQAILQRIINVTTDLGQSKTMLITNTPDLYTDYDLAMYSDIVPDSGSLGGIYTALFHSQTAYTVMIACDMPFVSADVLRIMLAQRQNFDAVVPTVKGYPQGLHAIYRHTCLDLIRENIEQNKLKVSKIFDDLQVNYLDESALADVNTNGLALMNVNTPDDLKRAREFYGE
ncbi:MAG: molybdenum cofactor guanylyltransferase [Phototrophicaceae bacterium]